MHGLLNFMKSNTGNFDSYQNRVAFFIKTDVVILTINVWRHQES